MPSFSQSSLKKLYTVHQDLITIFNYVVKDYDCTVTSGLRTLEEQQVLFAKGRTEPGDIVTNADGIHVKSNHQSGNAVDVVPYPSMWSDVDELISFGNYVLGAAAILKRYGAVENDIEWGGKWTSFVDYPHFQLKQ
jgi:peptidoglycan L-alanyl-D-glutamate endopeptidase CwlK